MGRSVWIAVVIALVPGVSAADKYDDAVAKRNKAADAYNEAVKRYEPLYLKWERYYKPIDAQYPVMVAAHDKASAECAKNKRTKACRDLTLAYAVEHKKYNALVWDKDNADPKQEASRAALKPLEAKYATAKKDFDLVDVETRKLFEAGYKNARTKAERDQLDAKLAKKEEVRGDKFAAGRSSAADAKNPRTNSSSSSSGSSGSPNDPMGTARDIANQLPKQ